MKKNLRWIRRVILVYIVIGIAFYYLQDRLVLHPVVVDRYSFSQSFKEQRYVYDNTTTLNIVQFGADRDSAQGVVLYFYDSKGNVSNYASRTGEFTSKGYEVWMMDYPGFGKSTGVFNEQQQYAFDLLLYKLARTRWKPSQIIITGCGFGTGLAAQLASVRDCQRLVLVDPYSSMEARFRPYLFMYPLEWMLHYHLPTDEYLQHVTAPVTVVKP